MKHSEGLCWDRFNRWICKIKTKWQLLGKGATSKLYCFIRSTSTVYKAHRYLLVRQAQNGWKGGCCQRQSVHWILQHGEISLHVPFVFFFIWLLEVLLYFNSEILHQQCTLQHSICATKLFDCFVLLCFVFFKLLGLAEDDTFYASLPPTTCYLHRLSYFYHTDDLISFWVSSSTAGRSVSKYSWVSKCILCFVNKKSSIFLTHNPPGKVYWVITLQQITCSGSKIIL